MNVLRQQLEKKLNHSDPEMLKRDEWLVSFSSHQVHSDFHTFVANLESTTLRLER
jgi:hypothetical protein|tara:strand:- start:709 stop:873 length:165 start_codon:yes stop_codon:yes gene_type:complete